MKERIITGLAILICVLPPLVLGGFWLEVLIIAFVGLGMYEMITVCFKKLPWLLYVVSLILSICLYRFSLQMYAVTSITMILIFFSISIFNERYSIENSAYLMVMIMIVALTVRSIHLVYNYGNVVMIFIVIATYMTDTGAYFAGRFFGKHKLNERISPKKTIEGSIGGYLLGALASFAFGYFWVDPILPIWFIAILSLVMPAVGQIGDLAFSAIKRHFDVKDFGSIFPGHGGVLDRIDSLIFNLLVFLACTGAATVYFQVVML